MSVTRSQAVPHRIALKRALLWAFAVATAANALYMLADPQGWYGAVAGVPDTGPFNPHFVRDIGVAYLTLAIMTAASARWLSHAVALMSAVAIYHFLHVFLHVWDVAAGRLPPDHLTTDIPGVLFPALIAAGLAWWLRNERT
jgi:hypothetical protein